MQKRTSCGMKSSPACKRRDHESTENYCILRLDDWIRRNHRSVWKVSTGRDRNGSGRAGGYCHDCQGGAQRKRKAESKKAEMKRV